MADHRHDWRVDPSQIIVLIADQSRFRVACAVPGCGLTAVVHSVRANPPRPDEPATWRPYVPKPADYLKSE